MIARRFMVGNFVSHLSYQMVAFVPDSSQPGDRPSYRCRVCPRLVSAWGQAELLLPSLSQTRLSLGTG